MSGPLETPDPLPGEALQHYESTDEAQRLMRGTGRLELARTQELIGRYLPAPPAVVLDVGGGPGAYACRLATSGYSVHLVDAVPIHVEQARRASEAQPGKQLASITLGDARRLAHRNASADIVLLLGPLYHLTSPLDRLDALKEARRVLREGGLVFAAAISRFASAMDGLFDGFLDDPEFAQVVQRDLLDGQHRNPSGNPSYFTTTFFHHPEELKSEIEASGLRLEGIFAVEGVGWLLHDFDERWRDPDRREQLLSAIRQLETEPSLLGVSAHILAVARK